VKAAEVAPTAFAVAFSRISVALGAGTFVVAVAEDDDVELSGGGVVVVHAARSPSTPAPMTAATRLPRGCRVVAFIADTLTRGHERFIRPASRRG
jgi:hypothetical protein